MTSPHHDPAADSTIFRMEETVGFNARVEPMWHSHRKLARRLGFWERWKQKRSLKRVIGEISRRLPGAKGWAEKEGRCVCNLRVARIGLIAELQKHLQESLGSKKLAPLPHLQTQRDRFALALPVDFNTPFTVPGWEGSPVVVTSSSRLLVDLAEVNRQLRIEETFALAGMGRVDYMDATERDISKFEARFASLDDFWPKFAFVLLKKLADKSVEQSLPIHFA